MPRTSSYPQKKHPRPWDIRVSRDRLGPFAAELAPVDKYLLSDKTPRISKGPKPTVWNEQSGQILDKIQKTETPAATSEESQEQIRGLRLPPALSTTRRVGRHEDSPSRPLDPPISSSSAKASSPSQGTSEQGNLFACVHSFLLQQWPPVRPCLNFSPGL